MGLLSPQPGRAEVAPQLNFSWPMGSLDPCILEASQNLAALVATDFLQNFQNVSGWGLRRPRLRIYAAVSEFRQWPRPGVLLWARQRGEAGALTRVRGCPERWNVEFPSLLPSWPLWGLRLLPRWGFQDWSWDERGYSRCAPLKPHPVHTAMTLGLQTQVGPAGGRLQSLHPSLGHCLARF